MRLTLDLPPNLEACLHAEAARHGMDTESYALHLLEKELPVQRPLTVRELLALTPEERRPYLEAAAAAMEEEYRADLAKEERVLLRK